MIGELVRFAGVGVLNTLFGFCIIVLAGQVLGAGIYLANAIGFAAGACLSYLLNRRFTFRSNSAHGRSAPLFVLLIATCYGLNLGVVSLVLAATAQQVVLAQLAGVVTYSGAFFLGSKLFVFRE